MSDPLTTMNKTVVLNVVGLTPDLIGPSTPRLGAFLARGEQAGIRAVTPAVTCSSQATYFTGVTPDVHGIVGNGWYFRDECEVKLWRQSGHLVQSPKIWDMARKLDPSFTVANMFWWFNMYSGADYGVTPRPMYPSDGRKLPDCYANPEELRAQLTAELGTFPLFDFWGPKTTIKSTQWIADASIWVDKKHNPTLTMVYLPHLDYCLQKYGLQDVRIQKDLAEVDAVCGQLIDHFQSRGAKVIVLSEYGITDVSKPIHINRLLREHGLIAYRDELGLEVLDPGASTAFAVADHQIAHVYINDPSKKQMVRELLESVTNIEHVLDHDGKREFHINHSRAGDLVAIAKPDAWFTYYYWLDDKLVPDYARCVDIHRKPGYDPVELFLDPAIKVPPVTVGLKVAKKLLGFRYLMDVIPLDATLVKGSHGRVGTNAGAEPLFATSEKGLLGASSIDATDVCGLILRSLTEPQ